MAHWSEDMNPEQAAAMRSALAKSATRMVKAMVALLPPEVRSKVELPGSPTHAVLRSVAVAMLDEMSSVVAHTHRSFEPKTPKRGADQVMDVLPSLLAQARGGEEEGN